MESDIQGDCIRTETELHRHQLMSKVEMIGCFVYERKIPTSGIRSDLCCENTGNTSSNFSLLSPS